MDKLFQIGAFRFRLQCQTGILPPPNFMLFETKSGEPEYTYSICFSDRWPPVEGRVVAHRPDLTVQREGQLESRLIGVRGLEGYYACYREITPHTAEVLLDPARLEGLHIDPVFSSLLALERRLIRHDSLVLHCAYVRYREEAILFTAPSETGKTTQAGLWERYRGSSTVNGDRALMQNIDGRWTALGWPVCGTSQVCRNLATPVRAIVVLSQGKENTVRRMAPAQAFAPLYGQLTVNSWDTQGVVKALDLTESLLQIPVFHLSCTISQEAVECLEQVLYN